MTSNWAPAPGTVLNGRYQIHEVFDRGGMGVLVRATHLQMQREVAVKILMPGLAEKVAYRTRFEREVQLITRVNHPNVVQCFDFGTTPDGLLFIVMELLSGHSLSHRLHTRGRMGAAQAATFALQLADSLAAAHRVGVVHRDIKPGNVFVTQDFRGEEFVKLLDFGIARPLIGEDIRVTATGSVVGTPSYLAPEVLLGSEATEPSDVYAWGLVVFEMLVGQKAFGGGGASMTDTFAQQLFAGPRVPARLWDHPLGALVRAALSKQPWNRPTAEELFQSLRAAVPVADVVIGEAEVPPPIQEVVASEVLNKVADQMTILERLPAPVRWELGSDERPTVRIVAREVTATLTAESIEPVASPSPERRMYPGLLALAALVLAVVGGALFLPRPKPAAAPEPPPVLAAKPVVAPPEVVEPVEEAPEVVEVAEAAASTNGAQVTDPPSSETEPRRVESKRVARKPKPDKPKPDKPKPDKPKLDTPKPVAVEVDTPPDKDVLLEKYLRVQVEE